MVEDGLNDILIVFGVNRGRFRRNTAWEEDGVVVEELLKATGVDFGVNLKFLR
jgi:hypothetical protein